MCAAKTNVLAAEIRSCATDTTQSSALQLRTGMATLDLVPGHTGTPYILVAGASAAAGSIWVNGACGSLDGSRGMEVAS